MVALNAPQVNNAAQGHMPARHWLCVETGKNANCCLGPKPAGNHML